MALIDSLKNNAIAILSVIALVAVSAATYEHFFSDKAKMISILKDQIKEKEDCIAHLNATFAQLNDEEARQLQEVSALKTKLTEALSKIQKGEGDINVIKNEIITIDSAAGIIETHASRALARGRDVMRSSSPCAGK